MDKAVQVIQHYFNKRETEFIALQLSAVHEWEKSNRLFDKITKAPNKEVVLNHLAELKYGLIFSSLGGTVAFEPFGDAGPDLRVNKPEGEFLVEVSRFQQRNPGLAKFDLTNVPTVFPKYGDTNRDTNKAYGRILEKIAKQCRYGPTVLALWNDDNELEEEVLDASTDVSKESLYPPTLLFVICKNLNISLTESQFIIHRVSSISPPFVDKMMSDLVKLSVPHVLARATGGLA